MDPNRIQPKKTSAEMLEPSRPTLSEQASLLTWRQAFKELGAEWEYNGGDVCALHTLSGKVSEYYFNSEVISNNTEILSALCREVYLPEIERRHITVDLVASYAPYGVAFANELARALGVGSCFLRSPAALNFEQDVKFGARILVVADDVFSGGSVVRTIDAARSKECHVAPVVFAFGNFSGRSSVDGIEIFAVIDRHVELFEIADSPLIARGVKSVNARDCWDKHFAPKKA